MIDLKQIDVITFGTTPIKLISFGDTPVWPGDYSYVLYFKSATYSSSTTNKVHATGDDYVTFVCDYAKIRTSTGTLVEVETDVIATPSAQYFIENNGGKLYYDYYNYKATRVDASTSLPVTLTYRGATTTTTFAFAGNTSSVSSSISPIVLSQSVADASGNNITYTGGDVTTSTNWTSGYSQVTSTTYANFTNAATNSQSTSTVGHIVGYTKTVYIPSLGRNVTSGQSSYTFISDSYNGQTVSVTVYQAQNARYQNSGYQFWDLRTDTALSTVTVPAAYDGTDTYGTLVLSVKQTLNVWYDADPTVVSSGTTVMNSDYDITINAAASANSITSVYRTGSENWVANYSPNTSGTTKRSVLVALHNGGQWNATLMVEQPSS